MSLIDADKSGNLRTSPMPNSDDGVAQRMAHNTYSNTYRDSGGEVTQRMVFKNGLFMTIDNEGRASSVYGYIPELTSVPVLLIARSGFDVFEDILEIDRPRV